MSQTVSNVEFTVTGKAVEVTTTTRLIELAAVKDGVTYPIVTMSIRAAKNLAQQIATEVAFEEQLPTEVVKDAPLNPDVPSPNAIPG